MDFIKRSLLSKSEKLEVFELWNSEYPEKLSYKSTEEFDKYLASLTNQSHILLIDPSKKIKGWYFDFIRENEKWFALILDAKLQGKGLGRKMLNLAKEKESELSGWVIDRSNDKKQNGEFYESPLSFYLKNGFELLVKNRLENEKVSAVKIKWEK